MCHSFQIPSPCNKKQLYIKDLYFIVIMFCMKWILKYAFYPTHGLASMQRGHIENVGPCYRHEQPLKGLKKAKIGYSEKSEEVWLMDQIPGRQCVMVNSSAQR